MVGNSDGIGLATTKRLLAAGWDIIGISRSESPIKHSTYYHRVADVGTREYPNMLEELLSEDSFDEASETAEEEISDVDVQSVEFGEFGSTNGGNGKARNIDMLMDVELEVLVELGRKTMLIKDVLKRFLCTQAIEHVPLWLVKLNDGDRVGSLHDTV